MMPPYGMTLGQVEGLLGCYLRVEEGWAVKTLTTNLSLEEFGEELEDCFERGEACR